MKIKNKTVLKIKKNYGLEIDRFPERLLVQSFTKKP